MSQIDKKTAKAPRKKPSRLKKVLSFLAFALINVGVIAYIAIKEFGGGNSQTEKVALSQINLFFILAGLACFAVCILMETFKYEAMIRATAGKSDKQTAFEVAVLGKYYDNITPLGAGGQPFQIFHLKKRGYTGGTAASLPIAGFVVLQMAFVFLALIVFIFNGKAIDEYPLIKYSAYIGLLFYAFVPTVIVLFSLMPKTFSKIIKGFLWIFHKMHIVKNFEQTSQKVFVSLEEYRQSLVLISKTPMLISKTFFFSLIYEIALMSMPYFVLRAFGVHEGFIHLFSLCVFIYAAISFIPTPGNGGAAESMFYAIFSSLAGNMLFWAVLVWRFLCYYAFLIMGIFVIFTNSMRGKGNVKKRKLSSTASSVQFTDTFFPVSDGVSQTVDSLAQRMNEAGYCCVVCPSSDTAFKDCFSYDVIRVPSVRFPFAGKVPLPSLERGLKAKLKEGNFTAFHAHSPFGIGKYALKMGKRLGVPVIASFHSQYCDELISLSKSRFIGRLLSNAIVKFYCRANEVWAQSRNTAEVLQSYGFRGDIKIVGKGTEFIGEYVPDDRIAALKEELLIPEDKKILLYFGTLSQKKNVRLVIDTMLELKETGDEYILLSVGRGPDEEYIKNVTEKLGLGGNILFLGHIADRSKLLAVISMADLLIYPSPDNSFPSVVREAAALSTPSLVAEGCASEYISNNVNGYFAEANPEAMAGRIKEIFESGSLEEVGDVAKNTLPTSWDEIVRESNMRYKKAARELQKRRK